jgi:hypothetical protein
MARTECLKTHDAFPWATAPRRHRTLSAVPGIFKGGTCLNLSPLDLPSCKAPHGSRAISDLLDRRRHRCDRELHFSQFVNLQLWLTVDFNNIRRDFQGYPLILRPELQQIGQTCALI